MWAFLFNEGLGVNNPPNPEKEWIIEESRPMTCPLILKGMRLMYTKADISYIQISAEPLPKHV